jgi:hypothetical protein
MLEGDLNGGFPYPRPRSSAPAVAGSVSGGPQVVKCPECGHEVPPFTEGCSKCEIAEMAVRPEVNHDVPCPKPGCEGTVSVNHLISELSAHLGKPIPTWECDSCQTGFGLLAGIVRSCRRRADPTGLGPHEWRLRYREPGDRNAEHLIEFYGYAELEAKSGDFFLCLYRMEDKRIVSFSNKKLGISWDLWPTAARKGGCFLLPVVALACAGASLVWAIYLGH